MWLAQAADVAATADESAGASMMSKTAKILRSSLIMLSFGAAVPAVWAANAEPQHSSTGTRFSVPIQAADAPPTPRILDLKAPDVRDVMTTDEMAAALNPPSDVEVLESGAVAVHSEQPAPYVPGGFAALYWAALHPFSAWRVFAPVQ
jgi:hypothetical protein